MFVKEKWCNKPIKNIGSFFSFLETESYYVLVSILVILVFVKLNALISDAETFVKLLRCFFSNDCFHDLEKAKAAAKAQKEAEEEQKAVQAKASNKLLIHK